MCFFSKLFLILAFPLLFALSANADPVTITSGFLTVDGRSRVVIPNAGDSVVYNLNAPNFNINGSHRVDNYFNVVDVARAYSPNSNLPSVFTYNFNNDFGTAVLNGVNVGDFPIWFEPGYLTFNLNSPVIVPNLNSGNIFSVVNVPFTANGILAIGQNQCFATNPVDCPNSTSISLNGGGTASYEFIYPDNPNNQTTYHQTTLSRITYTFSTPEPTPEPATMILLGTGLAGVFAYAKRKKKIKN